MATVKLLNYEDASPTAQTVSDDIMATRGIDDVNNFWKVLAHQPDTLKRIWENLKLTVFTCKDFMIKFPICLF